MLPAAALVLYVLQLHEDDVVSGRNRIRNPGGLYRTLARRIASGDDDLGRLLAALKRGRAN